MPFLRNVLGGKPAAGPENIDKAVQNLQHKDMSVRVKAARALGTSRNPQAVAPLIAALEDKEHVARGDVAVAPVAEAAGESLVQLGVLAVEPLLPLLGRNEHARDWLLRSWAASVLGRIGDPRATAPLITLLGDSNSSVRMDAIKALTRIGAPAREPLLAASQQESALVRIGANEALATMGESTAIAPLIAYMQAGDDLSVQEQAARALGNIGYPQAIDALVQCLRDSGAREVHLRSYALRSLIKIGPPAQRQVVALLVSDDHSTMRNAREALEESVRFGGLKGDAYTAQIVRLAIKASWQHKEIMSFLLLLGELGDGRGKQLIAAAARNDMATIRQMIASF